MKNRYRLFFLSLCFFPLFAFSALIMDQIMTKEEQALTGVSTLTPAQKKALEDWINKHCSMKEEEPFKELFVSIVSADGTKVTLSDSSSYAVAPQDTPIAASWITSSASIRVSDSNDPNYPYKLTNTLTKQEIKAKLATPPSEGS